MWLAVNYIQMFHICQYIVCICSLKKGDISASICSYYPKHYPGWFIHDYYTKCVRQRGWRLERLWGFIPLSIWKFCICFVNFLLVLIFGQRLSLFTLFILVGFNHLSMVIIRPINGLGWLFPVIVLWKLYHVKLYYINILRPGTYEWL